jgi:1,4-alpha-glucan branching enzyme
MGPSKGVKAKRVNFNLLAPDADTVFVAGDFNDWDTGSHPLKKDKKGVWKTSINLSPGTYQYRFYVDGQWQNDPSSADCVLNPFGTSNSVRKVE